jgi:crossover junction endodeoxyribonuclease RuvC
VRFIGIDPGLDGGIAGISSSSGVTGDVGVFCWRMPTIKIGTKRMVNTQGVRDIIVDCGPVDLVMLEDVNAGAVKSIQSAFAFGRGYGRVETVVECLDRPYAYVSSQSWIKHHGIVYAKGATQRQKKLQNIAVAARLFPNYRDALTDGMADALLIAEYGRRLHTGRIAA